MSLVYFSSSPLLCPTGSRVKNGQKVLSSISFQRALSGGGVKPLKHQIQHYASHSRTVRVNAEVSAPPQTSQPAKAPEEVRVEGVEAIPITKTTTCLRGVCNERLKFEIEYGLKRGTTENCYLIKDSEGKKAVLIDVPDEAFAKDFVTTLGQQVSLKDITAIIITHLTPRRLEALKVVLKQHEGEPLQILLSNPALQLVRESLGSDEDGNRLLSSVTFTAVKQETSIAVDDSAPLSLIPAPTPRWPDLLCVYSRKERLLFSSKLFGAHVAPKFVRLPEGVPPGSAFDDGGWDAYGSDWRYYFDCMLAPVARQAQGTLDKLDAVVAPATNKTFVDNVFAPLRGGLRNILLTFIKATAVSTKVKEVEVGSESGLVVTEVCPLHGPIVRSSVTELLRRYGSWTKDQVAATSQCNVVVMYASAYGNTAALAQAISRGITKAGVGVETLNLEVASLDEVVDCVKKSGGFVIGSPTLGGHMPTQVQTALGAVLRTPEAKGLPCGVFGSFGWSGEAVDEMEQRLKDGGFPFAFDAIRVKFKPTAQALQLCEESGTDLAQAVRKRMKAKEKQAGGSQVKAGSASNAAQALGRVVGSLCAVTARDGDAASAMLASWISQASFDPPGLTIAVKKERAVEPLLTLNNKFVVNIIAEGREKPVMKQLLKPFKPAEDRFEGIETRVSENTGCEILPESAAYLECTVAERMEAGDHWIVYAMVEGGGVMDEVALSSVHHRKTGTTY